MRNQLAGDPIKQEVLRLDILDPVFFLYGGVYIFGQMRILSTIVETGALLCQPYTGGWALSYDLRTTLSSSILVIRFAFLRTLVLERGRTERIKSLMTQDTSLYGIRP